MIVIAGWSSGNAWDGVSYGCASPLRVGSVGPLGRICGGADAGPDASVSKGDKASGD